MEEPAGAGGGGGADNGGGGGAAGGPTADPAAKLAKLAELEEMLNEQYAGARKATGGYLKTVGRRTLWSSLAAIVILCRQHHHDAACA